MVSFSHDFDCAPHVVHSPLTNYLFIPRDHTVEIWDVSTTGSKMVWEAKSPVGLYVTSVCPSRDGHRLLVGYYGGSMRMWNLDLEDLTGNRADAQDDTYTQQVIRISPSGKVAVTASEFYNIKILDANTGEVVARTDVEYEDGTDIAFSPDESQVAFLSEYLITIWDIIHLEKRVSFKPWPRKKARGSGVAFQTYNDPVTFAVTRYGLKMLQVWHWKDPAGFECTYSLNFGRPNNLYLAPDGLSFVIMYVSCCHIRDHDTPGSPSFVNCYSWNHDTAQFDLVHFDDQVHICQSPTYPPAYSPDGKFSACWSPDDSHVRVWDNRTGQLVSKFPASPPYDIALSPAPIDHSLPNGLIALEFKHRSAIHLFDVYNGHLYGQILGQENVHMIFIRDGTALACYRSDIGLKTWEIADLKTEHWNSIDGYELMMQGMINGWVMDQDNELLFWVPVEHRKDVYVPPCRVVIKAPQISTILDFSNSRFGRKWAECIDKKWLRELEKKEKEVGNLLE